jgi:hypothetical protein
MAATVNWRQARRCVAGAPVCGAPQRTQVGVMLAKLGGTRNPTVTSSRSRRHSREGQAAGGGGISEWPDSDRLAGGGDRKRHTLIQS